MRSRPSNTPKMHLLLTCMLLGAATATLGSKAEMFAEGTSYREGEVSEYASFQNQWNNRILSSTAAMPVLGLGSYLENSHSIDDDVARLALDVKRRHAEVSFFKKLS